MTLRSAPLAFVVALVAACGAESEPDRSAVTFDPSTMDAERDLNVLNWSDYIAEGVIDEFQDEFGIRVNYDVFDSNEVLETRLLSGRTGYDVVVPSGAFLQRQLEAGVYRPLEPSRLPNLRHLDPQIMEQVALHDPGNRHAVPYMWGTTGLGINVTRIRERMADAPLDSWRMLYDPEVVRRFEDCGVAILDAPADVVGSVLIHLGRDPNSEDPADLADAEAALMAIRPYVRYVHSSRYIDDLANGEVCLVLGWTGDVLQARDRTAEAGTGIDIAYTIPREGTFIWFDMLAVPADAPHPLNAHLFIDFLQRPEIAARNSSATNFATPNLAALPMVDESVRTDESIYPNADLRERLVPDLARSDEFTRLLTRTWTRFRTGR
jgi:putrescine transport system substrate-binding protein